MLTVACVLRSGGIYTPEWAQKLKHGVARNLSAEHRFLCLSDMDVPGVDTVGLRHRYPGWWSKIELFEPKLFPGPVLYLDLDCIVTGPLDSLPVRNGFAMCRDFLGHGFNSSVMSWAGDMTGVYDAFRTQPEELMRKYDRERPGGRIGDQAFIEDHTEPQALPDGAVVSYRVSGREARPEASVVAFHGKPKPHEAGGWATEEWIAL